MHQLFASGELDFTMSNNDGEVDNKVIQGLLPKTSRAYVLDGGTIQNSHYIGITARSAHKAAAMVAREICERLLDEPFAALDAELRVAMQDLYKRIASEYKITSLFVTHDVKEAILMGDAVALMESGELTRYNSRDEMLHDAELGLAREIEFWESFKQSV